MKIENHVVVDDSVISAQTELSCEMAGIKGIIWLKPDEVVQSAKDFGAVLADGMLKAEYGKPAISVHFIIDRDGTIYQLSSLDKGTLHTPVSGKIDNQTVERVNEHLISIMLVNGGECRFINGRPYSAPYYVARFDPKLKIKFFDPNCGGDQKYAVLPEELDTLNSPSRGVVHLQKISDKQRSAAVNLLRVLTEEYKISRYNCTFKPTHFIPSSQNNIGHHFDMMLPGIINEVFGQ